MIMKISKILGQHNGIQLIINSDGHELYYSTKTGKTAIGIKGLARLLGCDPKSVEKQLTSRDELIPVLNAEMYTQQGIQTVNLILEDNLGELLVKMIKSRMKKSTRLAAEELNNKLVQAGFRLAVMLEVNPSAVAKEAINHITDTKKIDEVTKYANDHGQYVRSIHAVNYEMRQYNDPYIEANFHSTVNKNLNIPKGKRPQKFQHNPMIRTLARAMNDIATYNHYQNRTEVNDMSSETGNKIGYKAVKNVMKITNQEFKGCSYEPHNKLLK